MKKAMLILWVIPLSIILVACGGGGEYDSDIESAINFHYDYHGEQFISDYETRENGNIVVHDNGKYITLSFFMPENDMKETSPYYYEKAGDSWNEMPRYEGERLINKTPDYQEQLGEEI